MPVESPVVIENKRQEESHKIDFSGIVPFLNSLDMIKVAEESGSLGKDSSQFYFVGERFGIISFVSKKVVLYFSMSYLVVIALFLITRDKSLLFVLGSMLSIAYSIGAIMLIERYKNSFGFLIKILDDILLTSMALTIILFIVSDITLYAIIPEFIDKGVKFCINNARSESIVLQCLQSGVYMKKLFSIADEGIFKNFTALSLTKLPAIIIPYVYFKIYVRNLSSYKTKVEMFFDDFRKKA